MELHLLEGQHRRGLIPDRSVRDSIFTHYGTTRAAFERTLDHYAAHPEAFAALYSSVVDTLRAVEKDLQQRRRSLSPANQDNSP